MGFLKGQVKQINSTPQDIRPLRQGISQQLLQGLSGNALAQAYQGVLGGGPPPAQDTSFFYNNILKPYTDLFQAQRGAALGQAKESAGNLTGSGYNNILGSSLSESLANQQATTAQTLLGLRQQELQRQQALMQMLFQFAGQGVGPNQAVYQPGFLDSILPFAGQVAGQYFGTHGFPSLHLPSWLGGGGGGPTSTSTPFGAPGTSFGGLTGNPFGAPGTAYQPPGATPGAGGYQSMNNLPWWER